MGRSSSRGRMYALQGIALTLLLGGCTDLEPCTGVAIGAKYQVVPGPPTDGGTSCGPDWGFVEDAALNAEIVSMDGKADCSSGRATLTGNDGWDLQLIPAQAAGGGGLLESGYTISRGACSAEAYIGVECDSSCLAGRASSCACRMTLDAYGKHGTCPAGCVAVLRASVTRL